MGSWITIVLAALLSLGAHSLRAGSITKLDDTVLNGEIVAFDGAAVTISVPSPGAEPSRVTVKLDEILNVRPLTSAPAQPRLGATVVTPPAAVIQAVVPAPRAARGPASAPAVVSRGPAGLVNPPAATVTGITSGRSNAIAPAPAPAPAPPADEPAPLPSNWIFKLVNGDQVSGTLQSWSDERIVVMQGRATLQIPIKSVATLWRADPQLIRKAIDLRIDPEGQDVAYVMKEDAVVAVKGEAVGIDDQSFVFRFEAQDRKISLPRLLGVQRLQPKNPAPADQKASPHVIHLFGGDVMSGRWTKIQDGIISFTTSWGQEVASNAVELIDIRNNRIVYLSDLKPVKVEETPYFDRVIHWRNDAGLDGGPLKLSDGQYERGIAMHSRCLLEYDLGGKFERLRAKLGLEPVQSAIGRASVRLLLDGKPLYENEDARSDQKPLALDLDVKGGSRLSIEVDFGRDQDVADRVILANARLLRGAGE